MDVIIANIPAIITPNVLNVLCSRGFYCNASSFAPLQIHAPTVSHSHQDMISFLAGKNKTTNSSHNLRIQYWGDSIQATMECDMRQWLLEIQGLLESSESLESSPVNISATIISSSYLKIGCPWHCDPAKEYWENLKLSYNATDVLVFNIGSHYELGDESTFRDEILKRYYDILHSFLMLEKKILLVRGPSATHFDTENGLANETQRESLTQMFDDSNSTYAYCSPLRKIPDVVLAQERVLSILVDRLQSSDARSPSSSVAYMDVYEMTKDRHTEHTTISLKPLDCKYFCMNCGVLRAWNALVVDYLMRG